MATIEVGMKRERLLTFLNDDLPELQRVLRDALKLESIREISVPLYLGDSTIYFGNEDMERDDVDPDEIYVDVSH